MTIGYLCLRYAVFGEMAREQQLSREGFAYFIWLVGRHLAHVVTGHQAASTGAGIAAAVMVLGMQAAVVWAQCTRARALYLGRLMFFGPIWWLIGVAPVLVAGYESPRHVYLAAVGWAIVVAGLVEVLDASKQQGVWRRFVATVGVAVLAAYAFRLVAVVRGGNNIAAVSQKVVRDVGEEGSRAASGSLLIIDAPIQSWEFAIPFAVRPPFTVIDLTERVVIVSPALLHCCREHWFWDTRKALKAWITRHGEAPVVVLHWDEITGRLTRATDREAPQVRSVLGELLVLPSAAALDSAIRRTVSGVTARVKDD